MKNIFASAFSHLTGGVQKSVKKSKAEEMPIDEDDALEGDEPDGDEEELEDDEDPDNPADENAENDESNDEKPAARKSGKASKAIRAALAKGRKAERDRAAAIFGSVHAAGREAMAAQLAFGTNLSAMAAISILQATPKGGKIDDLSSRMATITQPSLGPGGDNGSVKPGASLIDNAKKRAEAAATPHRR